ncbi:Zinc finger protein [Armadillidium nasatum]|uniref:Protein hunchback n=1 Tax=Armadillidium nasatum TaxID=96803 RepID=A0A5N5SKW5_9CRUS|nr:Zinc finger protein [Armadillidium nasatum]
MERIKEELDLEEEKLFTNTKNSSMEEALLPIYIKQENLEEGLESEEESFFEKHNEKDIINGENTKKVNDEKKFECSHCPYVANRKHHLKRHSLVHSKEKPFKCSQCNYSGKREESLTQHMLTHTLEKLFSCPICDYVCNEKKYMKNHLLNHANIKLLKCCECEYTSNQKHHLNQHMLTHSKTKSFKCSGL